ncbi:MAG: FHA domain-containing protein [Betaproteobacteria bacterium]|nr:FHA domain-containing protein [Betaproteobacteria bacterium]
MPSRDRSAPIVTRPIQQAVLFADVSGSTRLYERLGDRLALALIERCVDVMQQATRRYQGSVVKTIGDEVMAVFADAVVACRAAAEMHIMMLSYQGREYRVDDDHPTLSLGRDVRADIALQDKLASRNHCRIEKTRDKFTFFDFSSNGSYVRIGEGEELLVRRESIALRDSGAICFGRPVDEEPAAAVRFEVVVKG